MPKGLREYMTEASDRQIKALIPKDAAALKEFRRVIGTALRVMIHDELPKPEELAVKEVGTRVERGDLAWRRYLIGRKGAGEQIPAIGVGQGVRRHGRRLDSPAGHASLFKDGQLVPAAQRILDGKAAIFAPDVLLTGEFGDAKMTPVEKGWENYAGFYLRLQPLAAGQPRPRHPDGGCGGQAAREDGEGPFGRLRQSGPVGAAGARPVRRRGGADGRGRGWFPLREGDDRLQ